MTIFISPIDIKKDDSVAFTWKGNRVPTKELDRMFAEASKKLGVPEEELVYETFD